MKKRLLLLILSLLIGAVLWFAPINSEMPLRARHALAFSVTAILWWVFTVMPGAYTSLLLIAGFLVFQVAEPGVVLTLWTRPMIWLIISSFLLAAAVSKSGLAGRLSLFLLSRFASSYRRLILMIYVLGFLLSFLIPQAFPRALMLMAVVQQVIQTTQAEHKTKVSLGFAVFSSLTATSMFLLTGDVLLNLTAAAFSGQDVSWLDWLVYMSVPSLAASALMLAVHLLVFGGDHRLEVDEERLRAEYRALGRLRHEERITLLWVGGAILLWAFDSVTHIDPAWVAVGAAVGLAMPVVGEILKVEDITSGVSWPVIIFITGAFAIGSVSADSGLSAWLASALLPAQPPQNPFAFAALIAGGAMGVHMLIGSALATLSFTAPSMVGYAAAAGWNPLFPALLIYTVVSIHYLLPFHNVVLLIGAGETGGYGPRETLRFGLPMTLLTWVIVLGVEVPWWMLLGLI